LINAPEFSSAGLVIFLRNLYFAASQLQIGGRGVASVFQHLEHLVRGHP
jgi:hypothetical protein